MGPQEEYIETVVTCEGDYYDPEFHTHLQNLSRRLQNLLTEGDRKLFVKKVEPWNSVRVTFNIPKEAAVRLKQLAEQGDRTLRELGVLAVQIEGHRLISLTIAGKNNETTELVLQTSGTAAAAAASAGSVFDLPGTDEINIPGPSNVESTRRNIAQYLRDQGGSGNLFDSLFNQNFLQNLKPPDSVAAGTQGSQNPVFGQFPFGLRGVANHSAGNRLQLHNEQLPLPPGFPPGSFPSPSLPHTHAFSSPTTSHNQSPLSPNYPTPPPSVSNPSSPGSRTANLNNLAMPGINTAVALNSLPRLLGNRDITSSSPLLVNLLQNDIGGLAHLNNLMPNKMPGMPFPLSDVGQPPAKRRRKPRKLKPDAGKSRSPAGQEVLTGTASTVPVTPSTCDALQGKSMVGALQELSTKENRTNDLGQLTQEVDAGAHVSAASVMNTSLSSRSAPSGICHSPGQAVSPRVQSPRTQSPVCAQSPGWSKMQGAFGNNPPHIVNPVTGQLEPASCAEVQQPMNEHVIKDNSPDSDDMTNVQLQPPPNPLVELNKDINASKEANLEVPSLSAPSQKQSSPKAIVTTAGSRSLLIDSADAKSEPPASTTQTRSATTSAATSVVGLNGHTGTELVSRNSACSTSMSPSTSLPSSEMSFASAAAVTTLTSVATAAHVTTVSVPVTSSLAMTVPSAVSATTTTMSFHSRVSVMEKSIYSSPKLMSHSVSSSVVLPPSSVSKHSLLTAGGCEPVSSSSVTEQLNIGSHSPTDLLPSLVSSSEGNVVTTASATGATVLGESVNCITTASTTCVSSDVSSPEKKETVAVETMDSSLVSSSNSEETGQLHLQPEPSESSLDQLEQEQTPVSGSEALPVSTSQITPSSDTAEEGVIVADGDRGSPAQDKETSPAGSPPVLVDNANGSMAQDTSLVEHSDTAYHLAGGSSEDDAFSKSADETSPGHGDEQLKSGKSEQGTGLDKCESPDPTLSSTTPEHSGTDGSNTSSVTAHSQGKDSGIADVGPSILGSIACLEKSEEDVNSEVPEHGRSNGASTSEASPLSEVDTASSGHQSRSPSVRLTSSTGLTNHDSELSSHSFDDHICPASFSQNNMSERVAEAADDHDAVEEKLSDGQPAKAELHKCSDKNVITVGYALSKAQPMVDLSMSGLNNKSLPFLTEPSSTFEKESSSLTLKEFKMDDSFHAANNVQKMKTVSLTHSPLNNGEAQAKDCINWSKMLNLSPVLLGRSDLKPGGGEKSVGLKNCVVTSTAPADGDSSVLCSMSEDSASKVSLAVVDTADVVVAMQAESASADGVHATGILDIMSEKAMSEQGTGSSDLIRCSLVSETADRVTGDTRPECDDSMMASADRAGNGSEAAASPSISSQTEHGTSVPCVTSSISVSASVMASSPDAHTSTAVTTHSDTSCSVSSSSGAHSPISDSITVMSPSQSSAPEPVATVASEQGMTQTNTFGASMVTTIVTSAVSMGSALSTSFSMTASSASVACVPTTLPTMMYSTQVTTVAAPPVTVASSVPVMVSCPQDPKISAAVLHVETSASTQQMPSHAVPVTVLGPHLSGVTHQVVRMKQADRACLQALPRIVPMNNGVHVDQLPQNASQMTAQASGVDAIGHPSLSDQYESLKPHTVAYTVHPCATIHDDHAAVGQLHANLIHLPLVQSIGNCVSAKIVRPLDNQPKKLVMASLQHVASVVSQRSLDEKNEIHQEDVAATKVAEVCHNAITRSVSAGEPHAAVGARPGPLQLDPAQYSGNCMDTSTENRCSKDKNPGEQDKMDSKPSRGISIMKPLYDRESEIEEELHFVTPESADGSVAVKVIKSDALAMEELHTNQLHSNQLSNIVLPKGKSPFTIAQILEEADKQRRNQAQLKQKALLATQTDCIKPEIPVLNDSLNISQLGNKTILQVSGMVTPVKSTKSGTSSTPVPVKPLVPSLDFSKNTSSHLANFVQKSLQTPVLFNSAPHPITSPGFPLNLTESVKKVMNAIPRTDTTPPPSPVYNKGPTSLTAPPSPSRLRAKSTSPVAQTSSLFPAHALHKRKNDGQPAVSLESSANVKSISVADKNQAADDRPVQPEVVVTSDAMKIEPCLEMTEKDVDKSCSDQCLPASKMDEAAVYPVPSSVSVGELKSKDQRVDQTPVTKKYEGSGDDSFSSEHSYSAKPPGTMERPMNEVTMNESPKSLSISEEVDEVMHEANADDLEKEESVISLSMSAPIELTVVTDEQVSLDETPACGSSVVLSPMGHSLPSAEGLNKVLPVGRSDGTSIGSKIHMISPVLPVSTSRDEREGAGQTLVIKIVGAHAAPQKDASIGSSSSEAKLSPQPAMSSKDSSTSDLTAVSDCQKSLTADGTTACSKRKNSSSEMLETTVNHEQKSIKLETDSESVRSLSPVADDLSNLYQKRRSPSIDALSETSSTDGHSNNSNRTDGIDRIDSPVSRPMRMSTRNHGRRRNSPSDSSSDTPVKEDRGEGMTPSTTPKPFVLTRGSKRRLHSNHDDDPVVQEKKKRLESELGDASKPLDSTTDDAAVGDSKAKGNSGCVSSLCGKAVTRVVTVKSKANSSHDPTTGHDEKQKSRKVSGKVNDVGKEEGSSTKRGQKSKPLPDVKDDTVQQGKVDQKDDTVDTKGKRTTRSSRTKDHCELPNAALLKRRRSSRDHR